MKKMYVVLFILPLFCVGQIWEYPISPLEVDTFNINPTDVKSRSIIQNSDYDYLITGVYDNSIGFISKVDNGGDLLWSKIYSYNSENNPNISYVNTNFWDIINHPDGGYLVSGGGLSDQIVFYIDDNGDVVNITDTTYNLNMSGIKVLKDLNQNYISTGGSTSIMFTNFLKNQ